MTANSLSTLAKSGGILSKSPLGIVALFIVFIYGFATSSLFLSSSLDASDRHALVWFLIFFPVLILFMFCWMLSKHSSKMFGPSEYRDETNFIRMQMMTAASLTAASAKTSRIKNERDVESIVKTVQDLSASGPKIRDKRIWALWVDDRPENNTFERRAFEVAGLNFALALSTEQAFEQLRVRTFAVIISDMGRKEGPREGYALLDKLRRDGNKTPLFFYAASNLPEHKREILDHNGQGCTNNGQELFEMVMQSVLKGI